MFRLGESASLAVKEFAQDGKTGILDKQKTQHTKDGERAQGDFVVLDGFSAPPIESGAGETKANVFLDGNHTRVSLMSKLVPSPDWFVGLDSLNLCENGRFVDAITVEVKSRENPKIKYKHCDLTKKKIIIFTGRSH